MDEYITKEQAIKIICKAVNDYSSAITMIRSAPAKDVVEVTRCKDCPYSIKKIEKSTGKTIYYCTQFKRNANGNFYCGLGY